MVSERSRSYATAVVMEGVAGDNPGQSEFAGAPPNPIPAQNPANQRSDEFDDPLFLHVTENPNLSLVSLPLTEINYASWSRAMRIALEVKNKFGFVNGTALIPEETDPRIGTWRRCNRIVCSWILKSVSPEIAESIMYFDKASEIWSALQKRYSQSDPHKISEIQNEIFKNQQGKMSVNEYFTRSNALWQQLNALRPLLLCECVPRCSCTLMKRMQKQREKDQIIRFLEGFSEDYETIKSGVLVMDPIPDMEKVLNMTLKLERKIKGTIAQKATEFIQTNVVHSAQDQIDEEQSSLTAATFNNKKKFQNFGGKNVPKCTFCGMNGHTIEKCYKKNGYAPSWVTGYKSKNKQSQEMQQPSTSSVNHISDTGLSVDQFQRLLTLLQNQNHGVSNAAVTVRPTGISPEFRETTEGHSKGIPIPDIHVNTLSSTHMIWILDSGATDHITCSLQFFDKCCRIEGVSVKLPNGEVVSVTRVGQIIFDKGLILENVLYIPSFTFNIVSVSKLARQSRCKLVMSVDCCDIQGSLGTVAGFAKESNGLYLIKVPPVKKQLLSLDRNDSKCNSLTVKLWHNRLGHYPINKIPFLNGVDIESV
ncbi:PREDICTED: uncharacterized protein LOC109151887 [Ipomoea nil]|uniref:uncharacterized protein LOC109151887 n=1 Tax=Ipomoea nil TaxID=35883 RepID=UPI000901F4B3|nr:PREDICTED: uncharacterized protein LOC109151887 [Ipomoea nil]